MGHPRQSGRRERPTGGFAIAIRAGNIRARAQSRSRIRRDDHRGRTVAQNGNAGTDHGHGDVMWLLGGPVAGGKVHGEWPGLDDAALTKVATWPSQQIIAPC